MEQKVTTYYGFGGSAAVLPAPWVQHALSAENVNRDGIGNAKASATNNSSDVMAFYDVDFPDDQWAEVVIGGGLSSGNNYASVSVRGKETGASSDFYQFFTDGGSGVDHTGLSRFLNGAQTILINFSVTFATGDAMRIAVVGTEVFCYKNGVLLGVFDDGGSALTGGSPGLGMFNTSAIGNNIILRDWKCGVMAAPIGYGQFGFPNHILRVA